MNKIKTIYCDFDGTITNEDAVNSFFELYADEKWVESEQLWVDGKISSKENAINQVGMLKAIPKSKVDEFIDNISIDETFIDFIKFTKEQGIKFIILSDGFDLFIQETLKKYGLDDIEFYANHLVHKENGFEIEFPYHNKNCDIGAGMCKCEKVKEDLFCYIGDGVSDLCIAKKASVLFATKNLQKHCEKNRINYHYFNSFKDIKNKIKEINKN